MIVLVVNLGSTSFKYKLFDIDTSSERVLGVGSADRIGQGGSNWSVQVGTQSSEGKLDLPDHAAAIELHLGKLVELGAIGSTDDLDAIGFKAVHGGSISGATRIDDHVMETMAQFNAIAPAHNPPYIAAMKSFRQKLPHVEQVAAFETGFHQTIPLARQAYGVPHQWMKELGIRRYGFHGASHRYIASRMKQVAPQCKKIISLHLGGSCSISGIADGVSVSNSFGTTPQSGVFHGFRVGDFDVFALLQLQESGMDQQTVLDKLSKEGGLLGLSGVSADLREVEAAAEAGNAQAQFAVDAFVESCRHYVGAALVALGGIDAMVFTGGIGQFSKAVRLGIAANLEFAGIVIDQDKNNAATGKEDQRIDADGSKAQVWVMPTNEELIVARQTVQVLQTQNV